MGMMFCVVFSTFAGQFGVDGIYYDVIDETAQKVRVIYRGDTYYRYDNEYTGNITIPASVIYNGTTYSVTEIGYCAFKECTGLISVVIPNSITKINEGAFSGCTGLVSIEIPNSVVAIGSNAFNGCDGLTSIDIPNSVISVGVYAFSGCDGLISATIGKSVASMGSFAFNYCSNLTEVNYNAEDCKIKAALGSGTGFVFRECSNLKRINIGSGVKVIPSDCFSYCKGLAEVIIPDSVIEIESLAFCGCDGLTSVTIGNSVATIGYGAFVECRKLASVTIGNSVASIGEKAFFGCYDLAEVEFGNSVATIGNSAFRYCSSLDSIALPNSVVAIEPYAFSECTGLTSIEIPNSVTKIEECAFNKCYALTSVTIGNSVDSIGNDAFFGCNGLTEVNISDLSAWCKINFHYQNANPLSYAKKLKLNGSEIKDLVIPNDVTQIKQYAFNECIGLTSVTIPNSVTMIDAAAFYKCKGMTSVTISNSVTTIGRNAFGYCSGLTSMTIPNSVKSIGDYAFYNCDGLTSVTIPNSVIGVGRYAFSRCRGLVSVAIGRFGTFVGEGRGERQSGLTSGTMGFTSIGENAFNGCSSLTSAIIGESVASIGEYAFSGSGLKTIVAQSPTPPSCANSGFSDSYSSASLYVPKDSYAKYYVDDVWGQFMDIKKNEILASSISLNSAEVELDKGDTIMLSATIEPLNSSIKDVLWESSCPLVAKVDQSGRVEALSAGTATITATSLDGSNVSTSCDVIVNNVETKVTLSQTEANLPVNEIMTLSCRVVPIATEVEWSTSNENVAYIKKNSDNSVTVVGMADGVATITATALDGSEAFSTCVVTVGVGGIEDVEVDNNRVEVARYDIYGRKLAEPTKGINIIQYSNGTVKKVFVK